MPVVYFILKIFRDIGLRVLELIKAVISIGIVVVIILIIIGIIIKLNEES